ncbi:MAG: excinuclease ABC subunit UvrA [Isosphaeraceae bacterium]
MSSVARLFDPSAAITIRGARMHNLRDIDLDLPRNRLVVFTGVSGSGKSSLAFDTIFAEGQRRYIECLSSYARTFLDQLERPDVDLIEGLPPTVAIDQRAGQASPRSTVGTLTEIHDYLRLLYARLGAPFCPRCELPICRQTPEQMVAHVLAFPPGRKVMILAPLVQGRKGKHLEVFQAIRRAGMIRARVDGAILEVTDKPPELARTKVHHIEAVVDRLLIREGIRPRLAESIDLALKLSDGVVVLATETAGGWSDELLSVHLSCPRCGTGLQTLEPRGFSFNSPQGACPECQGLGRLNTEEDTDEPTICPACRGTRLRSEARAVRIAGQSIDQLSALACGDLRRTLEAMVLDAAEEPIARPLLREITGRLGSLEELGLGYLSLARGALTLSGGELQRTRLATQLGAGLLGVCYVLDEPTAGLHPRDTERLIKSLRRLQGQGNTVIVVEHDEAVIRAADWVVDLGPGAGPDGGQIVATGRPDELAASSNSVTGRYLQRQKQTRRKREGRIGEDASWIEIKDARKRNLKGGCARIPLGTLTCVTGVSGSGKSTLVHDVLAREFRRRQERGAQLHRSAQLHQGEATILGLEAIDTLIEVDQSPIGRTPRSTPATFTGTFDQIRRVFAATRQAKMRGYSAARFSFNARGGRCEACEGQGRRRIPMQFLPDLFVVCDECQGQRFNRQTLEVRFKGKSIGEVLELRVDEARPTFDAQPRVLPGLNALHEMGLGYLTLGQSSTTLSGGEAQRIKLAAELGRARPHESGGTPRAGSSPRGAGAGPTPQVGFPPRGGGRTLYILDEPTSGLHFADIDRLLTILERLVDLGNTVLVIEHNLDVIAAADWVIDLGPEGGDAGGQIVAMGPPETMAAEPESWTGRHLQMHTGFSVPKPTLSTG